MVTILLLGLGCPAPPDSADRAEAHPAERDEDGDGTPSREDCDDSNAAVHPGAQEVCNGVDDDCDTLVDTADADVELEGGFLDVDGDGWGSAAWAGCDPSVVIVALSGDCDDADAGRSPGATESCNGRDDVGDTIVDDACSPGLMGERTAASAEGILRLNGAGCGMGSNVGMLDLDGNELADVMTLASCDASPIALLGATAPVTPEQELHPEEDEILSSNVDWGAPAATVVDRYGDGDNQLVVVQGDYETELFLDPHFGMAPGDADLAVTLDASFYDDSDLVWCAGATLVGGDDGGAVVITGTWIDYDYGRNDTWVVDPNATGRHSTLDFPSLGPDARDQNPDYLPLAVTDVGDLDGDGQDELFYGYEYLADLYMGPLLPAIEGREPDVRFASKWTYDAHYDGNRVDQALGADLDGDGRKDLVLGAYLPDSSRAALVYVWADGVVDPLAGQTTLTAEQYFAMAALPSADGPDDLIVGDYRHDDYRGEVWREAGPFVGSRAIGEQAIAHIAGPDTRGWFGVGLATGDTNGDGLTDVAIQTEETDPGRLYVFLGGEE